MPRAKKTLRFGLTFEELDHCRKLVEKLCDLAYDLADQTASQARVVDAVRKHGLTPAQFRVLDEKPGYEFWGGYRTQNSWDDRWHWKLRRCRNNPQSGLFAALKKD